MIINYQQQFQIIIRVHELDWYLCEPSYLNSFIVSLSSHFDRIASKGKAINEIFVRRGQRIGYKTEWLMQEQ